MTQAPTADDWLASAQLAGLAARGFDIHFREPAVNQGAADAFVVVMQLDADHSATGSGKNVDFIDSEVNDVPLFRDEEHCLFVNPLPLAVDPVILPEHF